MIDLLYGSESHENQAHRNLGWNFLNNIENNLILKFIFDNQLQLGQNWSSLELIISDLAETISDIKNDIEKYSQYFELSFGELNQVVQNLKYSINRYENSKDGSIKNIIDEIDKFNQSRIDVNNFSNHTNPMTYVYIIEQIQEENRKDKPLQSVVDGVNEKFVLTLEELTDWLEFYLTYLDELDKEKEKVTGTVLDEVINIGRSEVINFNYTDTIKRFGVDDKNIHFIHGCLNFHRAKDEINTMVFGIEDKQADLDDIASELIPYQKFYQRVVKETGNDFEKFF
ncbi:MULTISPECIES: AbiH family protein [unclassified Streptococcus]|uniref:AbiH family protein n=1 Tax=unclassified Streptococcus TaxID=2608887 RepID=UPI00359F01C0